MTAPERQHREEGIVSDPSIRRLTTEARQSYERSLERRRLAADETDLVAIVALVLMVAAMLALAAVVVSALVVLAPG